MLCYICAADTFSAPKLLKLSLLSGRADFGLLGDFLILLLILGEWASLRLLKFSLVLSRLAFVGLGGLRL